MAKGKILKSLVKKKPSGIKKAQPRYVKTASGMKLNPERFKQKPLPKTSKLKQTKAAKKPGFKTGVAAGAAAGFAASQGIGTKKAKTKESSTKQMADEAYKKQKKRQKEYRQGKGGKGNR
jgi:hypothetical protein